ncbi:13535_t:CDS:2 [Ambispora gerdemannii]|uniref:13535_t:CDS:1 n=1 Tax=Ambispora gerdemannii TaxID=144530 RepID=A0A9N8VI21_9GLOM|nr:13535_t:CDS:2 [Ambispora gerdemannii]
MNFTLSRRTEQAQRRKSIALRGQPAPVNENSPTDCLKEPISQLASSFETLQKNFEELQVVHDSFAEFNESFSAFLYGLKMNANCIEFSEAPIKEAFSRYTNKKVGTPRKSPFKSPRKSPFKSSRKTLAKAQLTSSSVKHFQFPTSLIKNIQSPESTPIPTPTKIPPPNFIKRVIEGLPLKYREQQPHRTNVEDLLRRLFANPKGLKFEEIMQKSKLQRVRCNEYLVALVHAKEVTKENVIGSGQNVTCKSDHLSLNSAYISLFLTRFPEKKVMTLDTAGKVFSVAGRGLKLDTTQDVQEFVDTIIGAKDLEEVVLSGNTFGVEAAQAIGRALKEKTELKILNAADIFTGRLREEVPPGVKALCDALIDKEKLVEVNFSDNAFGPAGAEPMVDFLVHNRWFQVLKINNVGLGPRGGNIIGKALLEAAQINTKENHSSPLRTIVMGRNRLENDSSKTLANAIAAHGNLVEIIMPQNGIRPDGIITFSQGFAACKNLEILDLQDNTFTDTGSRAFAQALPNWPNLKLLNIGDCLLSEEGGIVVAEALLLGHNTKLHTLNLQYNEIDKKGIDILASAISSHLKNLSSLELNGNKVLAEDASIKKVSMALELHGFPEALGELDDMEVTDEEGDEEDVEPIPKGKEPILQIQKGANTEENLEDVESPSILNEGQVEQLTESFSRISLSS